MIVYSHNGRARSGASVGSLSSFRTLILPHKTNILLSCWIEAQLRCSLMVYLPFRLAGVDTVDNNSLKHFCLYVHWDGSALRMQRKARIYALSSVQRSCQHTARVVGLLRLH